MNRDDRRNPLRIVGLCVTICALLVAAPILWGLARGVLSLGNPLPTDDLIGIALRSIVTAGGLGVVAGLLGWSIGLALADGLSRGRWLAALLLAPALLPAYLGYAAGGLLLDPSSLIGGELQRLAATGDRWVIPLAARTIAFLALALQLAPIAAIPVALKASSIDPRQVDARRLLRSGPLLLMLAMTRRAALGGALLAGLVALGSAVPLHLAQLETQAIAVWRWLAERDVASRGGVWLAAAPLWAPGLIAGIWLARRFHRNRSLPIGPAVGSGGAVAGWLAIPAWLALLAAFGIPALLIGRSGISPTGLGEFWQLYGVELRGSLAHAGAAALYFAIAAWMTATLASASKPSLILTIWLAAGIAAALAPGVMIGQAWAEIGATLREACRTIGAPEAWLDTSSLHAAWFTRYAALAAVAGVAIAMAEPPSLREQRGLNGGSGPIAWWLASGPSGWLGVLAAGLIGGTLVLHEIEAAVFVAPPGSASIASVMLGLLHYNRTEELLAGLAWVGGGSLIAGVFALLVASAAARAAQRRLGR